MKNVKKPLLLALAALSLACGSGESSSSSENELSAPVVAKMDSLLKLHDDVVMPKTMGLYDKQARLQQQLVADSSLAADFEPVLEDIAVANEKMSVWMRAMGADLDSTTEATKLSYYDSLIQVGTALDKEIAEVGAEADSLLSEQQ